MKVIDDIIEECNLNKLYKWLIRIITTTFILVFGVVVIAIFMYIGIDVIHDIINHPIWK